MKRKIFLFIFVVTLCTFGFSLEEPFNGTLHYDRPFDHVPFDWPTSTPAEQGLDPYMLLYAYEKADELRFMYSLLVIRNGKLVAEQYFNGMTKHDANHIASATKSFVSALVGIALRENYLSSLDQKMMDFFPEYINSNLDQQKYEISIRELIKMRAGYPQDSNDEFWAQITKSNDWMKFAVEYPLTAAPGQTWGYSNASTLILSGIITKATGMSTLEFAKKYLFDSLNINIQHWDIAPPGYYTGYGSMYITPRNMARLGYLYLNNGFVDGKQIIPKEWIEESTKRYTDGINWGRFFGSFEEVGYGYLWWLAKAHLYDFYFASGYAGQNIIVIPLLNSIIVTTTHSAVDRNINIDQNNSVFNLIANYVLPAADGDHETPPYPPQEINGTRVENRSLLLTENIDILEWQQNPLNSGESISKYRIYYYTDESGTMTKVLLGEMNAGTTEYWCRNAPGGNPRTYGIASVAYDNRESVPAAITVR
jgi:CubicO group peptidase (beta-lactamase class C family)